MSTRRLNLPLVAILCIFLMACTEVSRKVGGLTANKYSEPRSGTVWVVPPPQLEPPRQSDRTVYISYRNISDSNIDLLSIMRKAAQDNGWQLTNNPDAAKYRLRVSTRFFGEVEPETGGAGVGRSLGGIAGAAAGVGTAVAVANLSDSRTTGVVAGGIGGALMATGMANASSPREWALVVDVILEERMDQPVEFQVTTESGSGTSDSAGTGNSRMASGGGTSQSNSSGATVSKTSNYFPHGVRLSVWANQMNMQEDEAMPHIEQRAERVVTQMLPI